MAFPLISRREPEKDKPTAPAPVEPVDEPLGALTARLAEMETALQDVSRQVMAYLVKRPGAVAGDAPPLKSLEEKLAAVIERLETSKPSAPPAAAPAVVKAAAESDSATKAALQGVLEKLGQLEAKLAAPVANDAAAVAQAVIPLRAALNETQQGLGWAIQQLGQRLEAGLAELVGYVRPPETDAKLPAGAAEWQRAILGRALAENTELALPRQKLLDDVLEGKAAAMALAGQLLVFQSAPPEKMSALLKEIGEAFYRWQPKTRPATNKFEEALVAWLRRACDDANLPNTIELVNPGERFDAGRHSANERGVEITQVMGWVVLRDTGRVYTKALVAVK